MRFLVILILMFESAYALDKRDAVVQVELHDRSGHVKIGRGMFISSMGEFAVLRSIMEPARKNPYDYLLSFKTADNRPLTDVKFSRCEDDVEKGLCFYQANYVPYRKVALGKKTALPKVGEELFYHRTYTGTGQAEIEGHPNKNLFWSTASTDDGRIPGTLLLDKEGEAKAIVTDKTLRKSNLTIPLSSLKLDKKGFAYSPIEQQQNNSLPKDMQKEGQNMARMVADINRMSEEQMKKAMEALFVPGQMGARAGLKKRQDNNSFRKDMKEEVMMQEASRGEEARRDFFKVEQQALDAKNQANHDEKEIGALERKLKGKQALLGAVEMQIDGIKQSMTESTVKLDIHGKSMTKGEKGELSSSIEGLKKKLGEKEGKGKALAMEVETLKTTLEALKRAQQKNLENAQNLASQAKDAAQKNAGAIQGANTLKGDLL